MTRISEWYNVMARAPVPYILREEELPCLTMAMKSKRDPSITVSPAGCGLVSETGERVVTPQESYREGNVITTGPESGLPEV